MSASGRYDNPASSAPSVTAGWTLSTVLAPSALYGANGMKIGPDGQLYVAQAFGSQLSALDTTSGAVQTVIPVGSAVIDYIESEGLVASVAEVGAYLKASLEARAGAHPGIGDVRGVGLFVGVEMVGPDGSPDVATTVDIVNRLKDKGFLTSNAGIFRNVVKIRPPLVFKQEHADAFLGAWDEVIREIAA